MKTERETRKDIVNLFFFIDSLTQVVRRVDNVLDSSIKLFKCLILLKLALHKVFIESNYSRPFDCKGSLMYGFQNIPSFLDMWCLNSLILVRNNDSNNGIQSFTFLFRFFTFFIGLFDYRFSNTEQTFKVLELNIVSKQPQYSINICSTLT